MRGLYGDERLAQALADARRRTLDLYGHLDLEGLEIPMIPIVNLPTWELAHIAWFQEHWCLRGGDRSVPTLLEDADDYFDSGAVAHATRWSLTLPPFERLRRYMEDTLDATLERLARTPRESRYFFELAALHEDMHGEALAMTLQTLRLPAPAFATEAPRSAAPARGDIAFEGGTFAMGSRRESARFIFDNEKWAHEVSVKPFAMAASPVTQGEYRAFVEDGGYHEERFWTPKGWQWRSSCAAFPRDWRPGMTHWERRLFDRWVPIEENAPVVNVSLHEAQAYCAWAHRRLPTEAEWEFAATHGGREDPYPWGSEPRALANLDMRHLSASTDAGDGGSRNGMHGLIGGVWEWTSTPFAPYPGFGPDPYEDYSMPWFHDHYVLRGGSFVTRARLVHNRFRNFYLPHRNDVFAGFRTCARER
jgi:iron(II)-dependent oxidoreductase